MTSPKLPPLPLLDPAALPAGCRLLAVLPRPGGAPDARCSFFATETHLVVVSESTIPRTWGDGGEVRARAQCEFPLATAGWLDRALDRLALPPGEPEALPPEQFHLEGEVGGERLDLARGASAGGEGVPGYLLANLSRSDHTTAGFAQELALSDPWLFQGGLRQVLRVIAARIADPETRAGPEEGGPDATP